MSSLPLPVLKSLIREFYEENDPQKLEGNLDLDGMAEWAFKKGEDDLNDLLMVQYQKTIDFSRPPQAVESSTTSLTNVKGPKLDDATLVRENLRQKLEDFFVEVDPDFDEAAVNELVEVGLAQGEEKINEDLLHKYGEGFLSEDEEQEEESPAFAFDELKVKQELRVFYKKHDPAYLDTPDHIDQVLELMAQIGQDAVYDKLFGFYHERVEDVVRAHHAQDLRESVRNTGNLSAFDKIDELRENLTKYYKKHDPEEAENIDDVIALGMDIGYDQLNENMETLYGESLSTFIEEGGPKPVKKSKLRMLHESRKLKNKPKKATVKAVMLELDPTEEPKQNQRKPLPPAPTPVTDSMSFGGKASVRLQVDRIRTPVVINPPTFAREKLPQPPLPELPPQVPPRVPPKRPTPPSPQQQRPETPPRARDRPNTPPRSVVQPPRVAAPSLESSVQKQELEYFYEKHDVAKLGLIDKIMKVAKKIGRERLNTKLMNFYSADLDTYAQELSLPEASYSEAFNQKRATAPYQDLDQLRIDLIKFYEQYDPLKVNDIDQIVQLGKRMGRKALVTKLEGIYAANVDVVCGRRGADRRRSPPQTPRFNSGPVPPPREREREGPPPFPSKHVHQESRYGVSPLPKRPEEEQEEDSTNYLTEYEPPQLSRDERGQTPANIQRLRDKGVPVIPMAGLDLGSVQLKKTGRNVQASLNRSPSRRKKKYTNSMYRLPKKKRYTAASMKLLSVNLGASGVTAQVENGGNFSDYQPPVRKRKKRAKVDVADLMV